MPPPLAKLKNIWYNNMNIYVTLRGFGRRESTVWLCIDRIEGNTVVLMDDDERIYRMDVISYETLVGRAPAESDVLTATVENGFILAARYDGKETERRKTVARVRLNRLFGKK